MRLTQLWQRLSSRERTLIGAALLALLAVAFRYGAVGSYLVYKEQVQENIAQELQRVEKSLKKIRQGPRVERRLAVLRQRYQEIASRLIPGETPSLAAAHLQERLQSLASQNGLEIVTTQVMRDQVMGEFHKTSVKLTLRGETPAFADFLTAVEYDSWWLTVATLDIRAPRTQRRSRRKMALRPLTLTMEVEGIMQEGAPAVGAGREGDSLHPNQGEGGDPLLEGNPPPPVGVESVESRGKND